MDRSSRVARVAARQRGLITHRQLLDVAVSKSAICRATASGRLHLLHRGVYLVGHPVPPPLARELAALLACGPTAALSHQTAAALWRILPSPDPTTVHVTVPDRRCRPRPGLRTHAHKLDSADTTTRHGLRLTTAARTLHDLTPLLDLATLERATNEAQVLGLQVPHRTDTPGLTRSEAERLLLDLLRRAGLPPTATNTKVAGHEVDVLYEEERLIVEVDGYAFHRTRAAFERDRRRDADLVAAGFRVMRVTWRQLCDEPEALVVRLARSLP
jgi:very-short-patch-repair endonuclease